MINSHNVMQIDRSFGKGKAKGMHECFAIKRSILFTGYLIPPEDSQRLIQDLLIPTLPDGVAEASDIKYLANSIIIKPVLTPKHVLQPILDRIGGIGKKVKWQVTGIAAFENKVWAARVAPIPSTEKYFADKTPPMVVLACRRTGRPADANQIQNWLPIPADKALTFESVIDEKAMLRICNVREDPNDAESRSPYMTKNQKRRLQQARDDDVVYPQSGINYGIDGASHHHHPYQRPAGENRQNYDDGPRRGSFRGRGRGGGRGRGPSARGGRGRGRGRDGGSNPWYKSLDDTGNANENSHEDKGGNGGGAYAMNY